MVCCGWRYCTAREHIVLATVCGQNVKFSSCNPIPSTPFCLCRTWLFIQVTVLGFSYLCATQRSKNFYRAGVVWIWNPDNIQSKYWTKSWANHSLLLQMSSDCNNPDVMFYTVTDCSNQSNIYQGTVFCVMKYKYSTPPPSPRPSWNLPFSIFLHAIRRSWWRPCPVKHFVFACLR